MNASWLSIKISNQMREKKPRTNAENSSLRFYSSGTTSCNKIFISKIQPETELRNLLGGTDVSDHGAD
jgi:intein-encoded DNA endonuclease-like protein